MFESLSDKKDIIEKAFLVGIREQRESRLEALEHLDELGELVETMGLTVAGTALALIREPNPRYLVGSGKALELIEEAKALGAQCVVIDFDLSPSQQRNWEKLGGVCVIDRHEVILEIFANRATTREATLQVALARMEYSLPRLKRAWTHLSRQRGGAKGTRGEGEKQLEADRRIVLSRVAYLKKELREVSKHRDVQRASRAKNDIPVVAIVGYTNVGKSSLLNRLSAADVLVENKLFATLDPTTRLVELPGKQPALFTDTVGFIRKLPHELVEAFKSTLEEAVLADYILHVMDVTNPSLEDHAQTTLSLLEELDAGSKSIISVYNKIDNLDDPVIRARLRARRPDALFVSAQSGVGVEELKNKLSQVIADSMGLMKLRLPNSAYNELNALYKTCQVLGSKYEEDAILVTARVPTKHAKRFAEYAITG